MIEERPDLDIGVPFPVPKHRPLPKPMWTAICAVLVTFWSAVKSVFPDAWGKVPEQEPTSCNGAGNPVRRVRLMDRGKCSGINAREPKGRGKASRAGNSAGWPPICRWTSGHWKELNRFSRGMIYRMSPDISGFLSNLLIRDLYVQAKGDSLDMKFFLSRRSGLGRPELRFHYRDPLPSIASATGTNQYAHEVFLVPTLRRHADIEGDS